MPLLLVAISAMLVQQTMATTAKAAVPVLFPAIADDLGLAPELVLLFTWVFACASLVTMLGCGAFIIRFGALRMSQIGCALMGLGLVTASTVAGPLALVVVLLGLTAVVVSLGSTVSTPASSQILARYAPPRWSPLVFSIKQTGVPAGIAVASFAVPALVLAFGWRSAPLVLAAVTVVIGLGLGPCRAEFDRDRIADHPLRFSGLKETLLAVVGHRGLRMLGISAFAFVGLQSIYMNVTVVYLVDSVGYDLAAAGAALGLATLVAVPGRIVWGWVGSTLVSPRLLLAGLAVLMAISAAMMGSFQPDWPRWAIMAPLVVVSATALSWHGVLLSEVARLSSPIDVGRMTGGVLAFGTAGQVVFPLLFWLGILAGGYPAAYVVISIPALAVGAALFRMGGRSGDRTGRRATDS